MPKLKSYDAVIVGAGPNGLAAAIVLAQKGHSVLVLEAHERIGGGTRTQEFTLPGFRHDICSAIHPMAAASPFFRSLPLEQLGLDLDFALRPTRAPARRWSRGRAGALARTNGRRTGRRLRQLHALDGSARAGPREAHPRSPGAPSGAQGSALAGPVRFARDLLGAGARGCAVYLGPARALFAGCAAHSVLPLDRATTAAIGLVLMLAGHVYNWPFPRGGSEAISLALAAHLEHLGGGIVTGCPVQSFAELPSARAVLFDVTPRQLLAICGDRLPPGYQKRLAAYRYGPGVFKLDWALDGPIPWRASECARAATVHLGGTFEQIAEAEAAVWRGVHSERPYVLLAQPSLFDETRAPVGKHTGWAYCHVPHGSTRDMTEIIERQVERFAPGFRDRIIARHAMGPREFQSHNANYVGGDITGGVTDVTQLFTRPVARVDPYSTPNPAIFICSSSTPPGAGVHGMCGYFAAQSALRSVFHHA